MLATTMRQLPDEALKLASSTAVSRTRRPANATANGTAGGAGGAGTRSRSLPIRARVKNYQSLIAVLGLLVCGLAAVNGLKCHMCGQYNEGVGSITPCLNYSDQHAHLYLRECSKKSEKFCVKYVSELSTVRDCATECVEKDIWETQTWCCNTDGCNGSTHVEVSLPVLALPLLGALYKLVLGLLEVGR